MPVWAAPKATPVTFHKDVAPLLQKQCTIPNVPRSISTGSFFIMLVGEICGRFGTRRLAEETVEPPIMRNIETGCLHGVFEPH